MKVFQAERHFRTTGGLHVTDITEDVAGIVRESGVVDGICCVYSPHTTCCVRVNEFETGMFEDFATFLRRLVPHETYYAHDDWDRRTENICEEDMEAPNGHAHVMSMFLGELCMGQWQRVLFIELDRSRPRRWICKVVGS
jgi:secondary thiamine-phosphate synthase enzyme